VALVRAFIRTRGQDAVVKDGRSLSEQR
jgi:hypothetical protein